MIQQLFGQETRDGQEVLFIVPSIAAGARDVALKRYEIVARDQLHIRNRLGGDQRILPLSDVTEIKVERPHIVKRQVIDYGTLIFRASGVPDSDPFKWENINNPLEVRDFIMSIKSSKILKNSQIEDVEIYGSLNNSTPDTEIGENIDDICFDREKIDIDKEIGLEISENENEKKPEPIGKQIFKITISLLSIAAVFVISNQSDRIVDPDDEIRWVKLGTLLVLACAFYVIGMLVLEERDSTASELDKQKVENSSQKPTNNKDMETNSVIETAKRPKMEREQSTARPSESEISDARKYSEETGSDLSVMRESEEVTERARTKKGHSANVEKAITFFKISKPFESLEELQEAYRIHRNITHEDFLDELNQHYETLKNIILRK